LSLLTLLLWLCSSAPINYEKRLCMKFWRNKLTVVQTFVSLKFWREPNEIRMLQNIVS
jgi:hypothetical protein